MERARTSKDLLSSLVCFSAEEAVCFRDSLRRIGISADGRSWETIAAAVGRSSEDVLVWFRRQRGVDFGNFWTWLEEKVVGLALGMLLEKGFETVVASVKECFPYKSLDNIRAQCRVLLQGGTRSRVQSILNFASVSTDLASGEGTAVHALSTDLALYQADLSHSPACSDVVAMQKFPRKTAVAWTSEEHRQFLVGLNTCGKGEWRRISQRFVRTRTPAQVASHAQKFFIRNSLPPNQHKRRLSLYDYTTPSEVPAEFSRKKRRARNSDRPSPVGDSSRITGAMHRPTLVVSAAETARTDTVIRESTSFNAGDSRMWKFGESAVDTAYSSETTQMDWIWLTPANESSSKLLEVLPDKTECTQARLQDLDDMAQPLCTDMDSVLLNEAL